MGNIHVKLYEIWTSGLGGDVFLNIFLIWSSSGPFVQRCNFGKGYYEEQFCEIILNLDQ